MYLIWKFYICNDYTRTCLLPLSWFIAFMADVAWSDVKCSMLVMGGPLSGLLAPEEHVLPLLSALLWVLSEPGAILVTAVVHFLMSSFRPLYVFDLLPHPLLKFKALPCVGVNDFDMSWSLLELLLMFILLLACVTLLIQFPMLLLILCVFFRNLLFSLPSIISIDLGPLSPILQLLLTPTPALWLLLFKLPMLLLIGPLSIATFRGVASAIVVLLDIVSLIPANTPPSTPPPPVDSSPPPPKLSLLLLQLPLLQ